MLSDAIMSAESTHTIFEQQFHLHSFSALMLLVNLKFHLSVSMTAITAVYKTCNLHCV